MFIQVETAQFRFVGNAQPECDVDHFENQEHRNPREGVAGDHAEALNSELAESAAIQQAVTR